MAKKGYPKIDLTIPDSAQVESESQRKLAESAAAQQRAEARKQASAAAQAQRQQAWASQAAGSTALSGRMPTATYAAFTGGTPTNATGGNVELTPVQPTYGENINTSTGTHTSTGSSTSTGTPTGEGGDSTVKPMTYAQWVQDAERQRQAQYGAAATSRQNAMINNQAQYQQGLSTYGARADSLGRMGLQGSGYADYLNANAYAAKVNADSAAMATEALAQQRAETTYAQNLASGRKEAEATLMEYINRGSKPSDIKAMAEQLGIADSPYVKMGTDYYYNSINEGLSAGTTNTAINSYDLDEEQKTQMLADRDELTMKSIFTDGSTFETESAAIAAAQANDTLTDDGVKSAWYSAYLGKIDNAVSNHDSWSLDNVNAVAKEIEAAFQSGKLSYHDRVSALEHLYQTAGKAADTVLESYYVGTNGGQGSQVVTIGNKTYRVDQVLNNKAEGSNMSRTLNYIATNDGDKAPQPGTVASLGDDYYVYWGNAWRYISNKPFRDSLTTILDYKIANHQAKDHQP